MTKGINKFNSTFLLFVGFILLTQCVGLTENSEIKNQEVNHHKNISDTILKTGWYYIIDTDNGFRRQLDKTSELFYIDPAPVITIKNFNEVNISEIQESKNHNILLLFTLNREGQKKWDVATGKASGKKVAFVLNNRLLDVHQIYTRETREWIQTLWENDKYSRIELESFINILEKESSVLFNREKISDIAKNDAGKAYRDLSIYDVKIEMKKGKWYVDYELSNLQMTGGGPHYVISAYSGEILSYRYEQ